MEAYKVFYTAKTNFKSAVIISPDKKSVEQYLQVKDEDYTPQLDGCRIRQMYEVSLSSVMLTDLSVKELLMVLGKEG